MKKIFLYLLLLVVGASCADDENFFDVTVPSDIFEFKKIPGGAVMYYKQLSDPSVYAIRATYVNSFGEEVLKQGSYLGDSLVLDGFNAAEKAIPVEIAFVNDKYEISKSIQLTFDTDESAPYALFNEAEVLPYWNGFMLQYKVPEDAEGFVSVFYMGINPVTQEMDSLLVETNLIQAGGDTLYFAVAQNVTSNTVIVKTEDFKGNIARRKVWTGVEFYETEKVDNKNFRLIDPFNLSIEEENDMMLGAKYLFDGDVLGEGRFASRIGTGGAFVKWYTFAAGPYAVSTPEEPKYFIVDVQEKLAGAVLRLYATERMNGGFYGFWNYDYENKLPSEATVYGSNDYDETTNEGTWTRLGSFYDAPEASAINDRWYYEITGDYLEPANAMSLEEFRQLEPRYVDINLGVNEGFRYYKIEITGVFETRNTYYNYQNYVTFHEIELFAKKN